MEVDLQSIQVTKAERRALAQEMSVNAVEAEEEEVRAWIHEMIHRELKDLSETYLYDLSTHMGWLGSDKYISDSTISRWQQEQAEMNQRRLSCLMNNGDITIEDDSGGQDGKNI